ncbi:MAG: hypothetical protein QF662_00735 [Phycisphaerae bacterium]|nr:hypothetical protein [Phycisphaerae bacterium]
MKQRKEVDEILRDLLKKDPRYKHGAYEFVSAGLAYTVHKTGATRHVSGKELCQGLREFAIEQFGLMARPVLQSWRIGRTEDFGEIVFNLIGVGLFGKSDADSRDDFAGVYDFDEAFGDLKIDLGGEE